MIDFANAKKPEYVHKLLQRKFPKDYWEQFNTMFGCLLQIIVNNIIPESVVMGTLVGELSELKHSFNKAFQHYYEEKIKKGYVPSLDDEQLIYKVIV